MATDADNNLRAWQSGEKQHVGPSQQQQHMLSSLTTQHTAWEACTFLHSPAWAKVAALAAAAALLQLLSAVTGLRRAAQQIQVPPQRLPRKHPLAAVAGGPMRWHHPSRLASAPAPAAVPVVPVQLLQPALAQRPPPPAALQGLRSRPRRACTQAMLATMIVGARRGLRTPLPASALPAGRPFSECLAGGCWQVAAAVAAAVLQARRRPRQERPHHVACVAVC